MRFVRLVLLGMQLAFCVTCLVGIFLLDGFVLSAMAGGASIAWGQAAERTLNGLLDE